jgi:hypothetical protein
VSIIGTSQRGRRLEFLSLLFFFPTVITSRSLLGLLSLQVKLLSKHLQMLMIGTKGPVIRVEVFKEIIVSFLLLIFP